MASVASTSSVLRSAGEIAGDIKLHHSIFALPFAVLGGFMAAAPPGGGGIDWSRFGGQLGLIVVAMFFARTVAMLANRMLDRGIDARNPRTAGRALPSGRVTTRSAAVALIAASAGFILVCLSFGLLYGNWWPAVLGVPVLAWLAAYPLLKRFTALCHLYLGASLALSPLAAAIAVQPDTILAQPSLWLLAAMVLCWVSGFDIIYALQDVEVDRRFGQFSIPARLGKPAAMVISRLLHATAVGCLVAAFAIDDRLGVLFGLGVAIVAGLLLYEHLTVARWGTSKLALAFFTLNGIIGCVLGFLGVADILTN
jgi:4-hydroxybenzoate polyprenyltransferase